MSASSSFSTLAVLMRNVSSMGYTPRAWDPSSLESMLNGSLCVNLSSHRVVCVVLSHCVLCVDFAVVFVPV